MPDSPDYSKYLPGSSRFSMNDMGELAVRLGSPVVYDRRGEVIWYDTFDDGITKWPGAVTGAGSTVTDDTTLPFFKGHCLLLTAGGVAGGEAAAYRYFSVLQDTVWGIYGAVNLYDTFNQLRLSLYKQDGVNSYIASLQINKVTGKLEYLDSTGVYVTLDTLPLVVSSFGQYHHLKVVADYGTLKYVRAMFNQHQYDLSGIAIRTVAAVATPRNLALFDFYSNGAAAAHARVGLAIVTANEP